MQFPREIRMQPSRAVMASVLVAHLAAALALFHVFGSGVGVEDEVVNGARVAALLMVWGVLLATLWHGLRAEAAKRGVSILLEPGGELVWFASDVEQGVLCGTAPSATVDLGWAVWLRPVPRVEMGEGTGMPAPVPWLMLVRANVGGSDWRALKIWLRHKTSRDPAAETESPPHSVV